MDQIEEIKRKIDIIDLVSESVTLKKSGRNFKANCPFHDEKTPSFMVSQERQIFKCFGCFPAGQLIKTKQGLVKIEDVKKGESVFSHKAKWRKVTRLLERDYQGDLVSVKTRKLKEEVRLTGDHKVYVIKTKNCKYKGRRTRLCQSRCDRFCPEKYFKDYKVEKVEARTLSRGDYLLYPLDKAEKDVKEIDLKKYITKKLPPHGTKPRKINYKILVEKDFLKLIGYWIAEGSSHRAYIRFSLGDHEKEFIKDIQKIIKRLFGLETSVYCRENSTRTGTELSCCHSMLSNIFVNLCGRGAENKHIPSEFERLPNEKLKILLEAIFRGDGYLQKKRYKRSRPGNRYIATVSHKLAHQLKEILLRLGYEPSLYVREAYQSKDGVNHKKCYTVYWRRDLKASYTHFWTEKGVNHWLLPISEIKKSKFKGKVYNFTVGGDHSYVANNFVVANCGEGGDVFGWLMKREGMEFGEALRTLADKAGVKLKSYKPTKEQQIKDKLLEINHLSSEYYHYLLTSHKAGKEALRYLLKRGITKASIKAFKLGYSVDEWEGLVNFLVKKKGYKLSELEIAGLVIKGQRSYYDRFRHRVMFPLYDHRNRVVGFAGRVFQKEQKQAKYVNSPETALYHKSDVLYGLEKTKGEIKKKNKAVVVEGEIDAISSYQAGVKNVVAIKGSALTEGQVDLLKRFCENVALALDEDTAGDQAARRGIEVAEKAGLSVRIIKLKYGKDPDECAQKSARLWKDSVKTAIPIYDFYIESAVKRFGVKSPEGKRKISQEVVEILAKISNQVIKAHYVKKLAGVLDVGEEAVLQEIDKAGNQRQGRPERVLEKREKSREDRLTEYVLALVLQVEGEVGKLTRKVSLKLLVEGAVRQVLAKLKRWMKTRNKFNVNKFVDSLPEELVGAVDQAYLTDLGRMSKNPEKLEQELNGVLEDLERISLKTKLEQLTEEIKQAEKDKKETKLRKLQEKFVEVTRALAV